MCSQFWVLTEWHLPCNFAGVQVEADKAAPRWLTPGIPVLIKKPVVAGEGVLGLTSLLWSWRGNRSIPEEEEIQQILLLLFCQ